MKILIAVPTFETISPDTFKSIYDLEKGPHDCRFDFVRGYDCATARNYIAQKGLDIDADYILMVDNDITLPQDALLNMLEGEKDVCLGFYPYRNAENMYNGKSCLCRIGEFNYTQLIPCIELRKLAEAGLHKILVHGGGMGCALIKTEVFRRLPFPWFDWVNYPDRGVLSEDLYLCEQCGNAGIEIYADTRAGCGHLMRHVQWPE